MLSMGNAHGRTITMNNEVIFNIEYPGSHSKGDRPVALAGGSLVIMNSEWAGNYFLEIT
jgi:hypothetical protein